MPVSALVFKVGVLVARLHQFGTSLLFMSFFYCCFQQLSVLVPVDGFQFSFWCYATVRVIRSVGDRDLVCGRLSLNIQWDPR